MNQEFYQELIQHNPGLTVLRDEPMARHTTFHIGGPAEYFAEPDEQQLIRIVEISARHGIPLTIIGNGSNLLVRDGGIRGMVVAIAKQMSDIRCPDGQSLPTQCASELQPSTTDRQPLESQPQPDSSARQQDAQQPVHIYAESGAMLSKLANTAARMGLTGLEFAAGIPGSVGGAIVMNAGAYGGEIKDVLFSVRVLAPDTAPAAPAQPVIPDTPPAAGRILTIPAADLDLSYRHSIIPENGYIVLGAEFALQPGDPQTIAQTMADLRACRTDKQPLEYYSAGSTFKRPEGYFAGKLIMDAGLRGYRIGDAQVSEKHCGFVINRGSATAADVLQLVADVQEKVHAQFGVAIEPEIKIIGESDKEV